MAELKQSTAPNEQSSEDASSNGGYQARQLAWHRGDWLLQGTDVTEVELKVIFGVPRVKLSLDGRTVPFAIDTGSNSCVMLQTEAFDEFVEGGIIVVNPVRGRANGALATKGQSRQGWFLKGQLMGKELRGGRVRPLGKT